MSAKILHSDLSLLVDIMYYDFILYKMVENYRTKTSTNAMDDYFKIVKVLFKKFKNNDIVLDSQTSLKILYIQLKRILYSVRCNSGDNKSISVRLCCSDHLCSILEKIYTSLCEIKNDHPILIEEKIYKDMIILVTSLILIYFHEIDKKKEYSSIITRVTEYCKSHNLEIKTIEDYNRLKKSMYLKLGVRQENEFEDKMLKAIENILEKTFNLLNEPYLYSLTAEKVTSMFRKHSMIFKEEKEMIKISSKDIFKPETPGEIVKWDEK